MKLKNPKWKRILRLADFMDALPRKKFNFEHWVGGDWKGAKDFSCGTTACALGWATTMPYFRRLGLKMAKSWQPELGDIRFSSPCGYTSFGEFFGIDISGLQRLFVPDIIFGPKISTPKQWARHARRIVKELNR